MTTHSSTESLSPHHITSLASPSTAATSATTPNTPTTTCTSVSSKQSARHGHSQILTSTRKRSIVVPDYKTTASASDDPALIGRLSFIWTRQQSPEWKPRRASVATCHSHLASSESPSDFCGECPTLLLSTSRASGGLNLDNLHVQSILNQRLKTQSASLKRHLQQQQQESSSRKNSSCSASQFPVDYHQQQQAAYDQPLPVTIEDDNDKLVDPKIQEVTFTPPSVGQREQRLTELKAEEILHNHPQQTLNGKWRGSAASQKPCESPAPMPTQTSAIVASQLARQKVTCSLAESQEPPPLPQSQSQLPYCDLVPIVGTQRRRARGEDQFNAPNPSSSSDIPAASDANSDSSSRQGQSRLASDDEEAKGRHSLELQDKQRKYFIYSMALDRIAAAASSSSSSSQPDRQQDEDAECFRCRSSSCTDGSLAIQWEHQQVNRRKLTASAATAAAAARSSANKSSHKITQQPKTTTNSEMKRECDIETRRSTASLSSVCRQQTEANQSGAGAGHPITSKARQQQQQQQNQTSTDFNLESLIIESWLDDHADFVRDYFMRKATHQLVDDWLLAHAKVSNTNINLSSRIADKTGDSPLAKLESTSTSASPRCGSSPLLVRKSSSSSSATASTSNCSTLTPRKSLRELQSECTGGNGPPDHFAPKNWIANSADATATGNSAGSTHVASSNVQSPSGALSLVSVSYPLARSTSHTGTVTPARKISATDFESRSGSGFLRPMVSTTPDGRPTFLAQTPNFDNFLFNPSKPQTASNETTAPSTPELLADRSRCEQLIEQSASRPEGDKSSEEERRELKLIFELVKDICDDLDIRTLLHKILKNIAVLINADKSSLFLVCGAPGDPNRHLVSQLFDVDQESPDIVRRKHTSGQTLHSGDDTNESDFDVDIDGDLCIKIPWGTGLVGYVARSGESVNIANCYEDPRFTNAVDKRTGYVTKHMMCAPIFDNKHDIVGVAQVINKRDGNPFSKGDELKFERYLQFCGIGLRNAQSYEQCQLENRRNQVLLDLARMVFEEQSSIEQVVYKIMLHTQSLLECQRCQVLLISNGSDDIDQLLQSNWQARVRSNQTSEPGDIVADQQAGGASVDDQAVTDSCQVSRQRRKPAWRPQCNKSDKLVIRAEGSIKLRQHPPADEADENDDVERDDDESPDRGSPSGSASLLASSVSSSPGSLDSIELSESKLFSLVFDLECDGNDLVMHSNREAGNPNASQQQTDQSNNETGRRRFPINIGITSYVAMTGETLNIEDAHLHDRFDPSVDDNSNFRHKSILCMPIRNGQRQIIGVSQLINKKNGKPFNKNDEDFFEAFAIFCGLGIHNTLMYEKVLKIMAKQRVTFDVLSYHATAPLEEAKKLNQEPIPSCFALNLTSLKFNDFSLDEQYMLKSCLRFFLDLDLMRRFQIDQLVLCNWVLSVQKNYRKITYHPIVGGNGLKESPVRYHNWRHAFNVSQMMFAILVNTQVCRVLGELETLALLIACLCHDLDHRGTNNSFQIKSASPLAELYSTSTMEHHHFDQCVMILNSQGNQILSNLTPYEYSRVISLLEEAIIATDLANYFQKRDLFFQLVDSNQLDSTHNQSHRSLLRCMLMTACDIAAITKPWPVQKIVADLVMSEFYQQGDIERTELNIEPIDMMNRDKMSKLPEMQIGFIDSICAPIYTAFAKLYPRELAPLLEGCLSNRKLWDDLANRNSSTSDLDCCTAGRIANFIDNNNRVVVRSICKANHSSEVDISDRSCRANLEPSSAASSPHMTADQIDDPGTAAPITTHPSSANKHPPGGADASPKTESQRKSV